MPSDCYEKNSDKNIHIDVNILLVLLVYFNPRREGYLMMKDIDVTPKLVSFYGMFLQLWVRSLAHLPGHCQPLGTSRS